MPGAGSRVPKSSFVHGSMSLRNVHDDGIEGGWPSVMLACNKRLTIHNKSPHLQSDVQEKLLRRFDS
jgi:hypothetical protein